MSEDSPFDRKAEAEDVLASLEGSGFLFTLDQIEKQYTTKRFKSERIFVENACACEALKGTE